MEVVSMPTNPRSHVRVIAERVVPDGQPELALGLAPVAPPAVAKPSRPSRPRSPRKARLVSPTFLQEMTAIMTTLAMLLAARALLLLGLLIAGALTVIALYNPQPIALLISGMFDVFVFLPLVALYMQKG